MPKRFDNCVKRGGDVRTKSLDDDRYMHICYDRKSNKSYVSHIKHRKITSAITKRRRRYKRR